MYPAIQRYVMWGIKGVVMYTKNEIGLKSVTTWTYGRNWIAINK